MCMMYVSFGSKIRPRTFVCVAMRSAVLFILMSRLHVYSAGAGGDRVHVVLSGLSLRLFCLQYYYGYIFYYDILYFLMC